jgi:hypothetical protein
MTSAGSPAASCSARPPAASGCAHCAVVPAISPRSGGRWPPSVGRPRPSTCSTTATTPSTDARSSSRSTAARDATNSARRVCHRNEGELPQPYCRAKKNNSAGSDWLSTASRSTTRSNPARSRPTRRRAPRDPPRGPPAAIPARIPAHHPHRPLPPPPPRPDPPRRAPATEDTRPGRAGERSDRLSSAAHNSIDPRGREPRPGSFPIAQVVILGEPGGDPWA